MSKTRTGLAVVAAAFVLSACATKGYVRRQVQAATDSTRLTMAAGDSAIKVDVTTRLETVQTNITGVDKEVDSLGTVVAAMQRDLNALRDSLGAVITAMENTMKVALPVTFAFDDATVREEDRPTLDRFAQVLTKHFSGAVVTVEGFADPAGSQAYNRRLSKQRADNVMSYLQQAGLSSITIRSVGMGETRLVADGASNDDPGADTNRRVVFVVESVMVKNAAVAAGGK